MPLQGAFFSTAASQFFEHFTERLSSLQQKPSVSSTVDGPIDARDDGEAEPLSPAQGDHLLTLFRRWYEVLGASAGLSQASAPSSHQQDAPTASRKRSRDFSFARGDCGESFVQLPHMRLIPTEWRSAAVLAAAPPLAGAAATLLAELTADMPVSTDDEGEELLLPLLSDVACTLASLSPLYEAFFILFCGWHRFVAHAHEPTQKASGPKPGALPAAAHTLLEAVAVFVEAWRTHMTSSSDGGRCGEQQQTSVSQDQCVAAAQELLTPISEDASEAMAPTWVTGAAALFFTECERLAADGRAHAFGTGTLPLAHLNALLEHVQVRVQEVLAARTADPHSPVSPPQRRRLRVGTLVACCRDDPRGASGTGRARAEGRADDFPDDDEEDHDDDADDDDGEDDAPTNAGAVEHGELGSSLSSYSVWSDMDETDAQESMPPPSPLRTARGRPLQNRATPVVADVDSECVDEQVSLTEAWRRRVSLCSCPSLISPLLTTYTVDVVHSADRHKSTVSQEQIYRVGEMQRVVFEGVAVDQPEYAARTGTLQWFTVSRPQRRQNAQDGAA